MITPKNINKKNNFRSLPFLFSPFRQVVKSYVFLLLSSVSLFGWDGCFRNTSPPPYYPSNDPPPPYYPKTDDGSPSAPDLSEYPKTKQEAKKDAKKLLKLIKEELKYLGKVLKDLNQIHERYSCMTIAATFAKRAYNLCKKNIMDSLFGVVAQYSGECEDKDKKEIHRKTGNFETCFDQTKNDLAELAHLVDVVKAKKSKKEYKKLTTRLCTYRNRFNQTKEEYDNYKKSIEGHHNALNIATRHSREFLASCYPGSLANQGQSTGGSNTININTNTNNNQQ